MSSQQEVVSYFGTWKFHKFYGCFNYCKSTVIWLHHLNSMTSVPWKIHHTGNLSEVYISTSWKYTIYPEATQRSPMDWTTLHLSPAVTIASKAHFSVLPSDHPQFFPYTCWQQRLSVWPGPGVRDKAGSHQLNLHGLSTVAGTLTGTCLSASANDVTSQLCWVHTV